MATHLQYMAEYLIRIFRPELSGADKVEAVEALNRELFDWMQTHGIELRYRD